MSDYSQSLIDPDAPIRTSREDLFSFAPLARTIATHILAYNQPESVVLGVSGTWGSGKTSLLNLINEAISNQCESERTKTNPIIIRYSPWIIGNRRTLLADFLLLLCTKLVHEPRGWFFGLNYLVKLKRQYWDFRKFRQYALAVSGRERDTGLTSRVTSKIGFPILSEVWEIITKFIKSVWMKPDVLSFDDLRTSACNALERQNKRIIVLLDDLDRLEPEEIMELLRLVRSTAQLPNITYILSFDKKIVTDTVKSKQGTHDDSYAEKIVQLYIDVPKLQPTVLLELLKGRVTELLTNLESESFNDSVIMNQLFNVSNLIAPMNILKTPRDVTRIFNLFALETQNNKNTRNKIVKTLLSCIVQAKLPKIYECVQQYTTSQQLGSQNLDEQIVPETFTSELRKASKNDNIGYDHVKNIISLIFPYLKWS